MVPLGVTDPKLPASVLVWGDSHAMAAMPAVDAFLKEKGVAGRAATHSGTPPVLDWLSMSATAYPDAVNFNNSVFSYISSHKIPVVILSACWKAVISSPIFYSGHHNSLSLSRRRRG